LIIIMQQKQDIRTYQNDETIITVKESWCKTCGICINYCPRKVLVPSEKGHPVAENIDDCIHCMLCELRCPDFAIMVEKLKKPVPNSSEHRNLED